MKTISLDKHEKHIFKLLSNQLDALWNHIAIYLNTHPHASFEDLLNVQTNVKSAYDMTLNDQILNANTQYEWLMCLKQHGIQTIHKDDHRSCMIIPKFTFLNQMLGNTLHEDRNRHQHFMIIIDDRYMSSIKVEPLLY